MELMTYKTRAVRTLSLLILVALLAALNPPSLTDSSAFAQTATTPTLSSSADTANQVDLSWTEVTGADDYELWRWETSEGWVEVDDSIEGTSYSDTGVTAGNTYYYQVSADGGSTWSNRVNETVGAYDASTLAAPTVTSSSVSLSWGAVTGATSYALWRFETSWAQVGGALTGTSYTDDSVEIGKTYYYQVMANGPNGDGAWSNRVEAVVPTTTPGAPLNFSATPGDAQVSLSWDPPTSDGGRALTGYQYRYQAVGGTWSGWMATSPALSRTATVTGLANETNHNFEVQAVNANGAGATAADDAMPMSTVPGIPAGLGTTSTGPTEITLSWSAVTGAASYQLQRRTNGGAWGTPMDAGSRTTYTDTGLDPSTTYDYEVRSVNTAGSSGWSGVVTASTTAATAPDAVSDLDAMAGASSITLSWSAPDSNGADISGYDLDVSDDDSSWSDLATLAATATSHEHMNLGPGTMKYYRIRAMNSVGYSDWSASDSATVAAVVPGKPSLIATAGDGLIMLSWVAPSATGGADITGYTIQVSINGTTGWGNLATKAADDTTHDHTNIAPGTTRYYRISARNSVGSGAWSDVASATTGGAAPPAGAATDATSPRNLSVTAVDINTATQGTSTASLNLAWLVPTDPPDDGDGTTNFGYEAEVWNPATQTWGTVMNVNASPPPAMVAAAITVDGTTQGGSLTDSGLMGTTEYTYRVRAVDGTMKGSWSTQEAGTTVAISPSQPTLTATAMGTDKIVLTWTVPDDGGDDIIGYVLRVGQTSGSLTDYLQVNDAGEVVVSTGTAVLLDPAHQSITHSGLAAGATWYYDISALNGVVVTADTPVANAAWSDESDEASATTATGVPGAPTSLGFVNTTAGQIGITVTANDNTGGSAITTTEIQQYNAASDSWTLLQDNATAAITVSDLENNVMYYFRARSKNANGAGPWFTDSVVTADGPASAPKLTATVNGPNSITLSWTVPENNGGNPITDYVLEVTDTADGTFSVDTTAGSGITADDVTGSSLTATHMGLSAGDTRYYRVQATTEIDGSATAGAWSNVVSETTSTGGVPAAPTWAGTPLAASTAAPHTITIDWEDAAANSDITGYDIAMWEDGEWVIIASNIARTPTQHIHSDGLSGATTYYFSIRARNANGAGPWSTVQSVLTATGTPGKPVLTATPDGATKVVLTWTAPDSGGSTITNYAVQVSTNPTVGWTALDSEATTASDATLTSGGATDVPTATGEPAPPLTVTHSGLTGMQTRYYRVAAATGGTVSDTSIGAWSEVVSATTPAGVPGMPVVAATTSGDTTPLTDEIRLTWPAPDTGGSAITGYQVQVWSSGEWMDLAAVTSASYNHEDLPGMTTRYYRVRAMNAVGYGPWSATATGSTAAGKPGAPVLHADQNGSSEIRLTWTAPENGGTPITNYQIQVSTDGTSGWTSPEDSTDIIDGERVTQVAATPLNYAHTGLDPSVTRYYRIRAINAATAAGRGLWSNVAMASTLGGRPGRPTLTATASGTSIISLAWTPPTGDGGSAVTGYELEYWDGSNGWMALDTFEDDVTSYTDRNIAGGTTKFYRIRAENSGGTGNWSTTAYATTATTAPLPPTLVATADGATTIMLTWTAGHDGGLAITGYHLQASSNAGQSWVDIDDSIAPGLTMEHTDDDLTGGTTKHYRIRATNSKGVGGWSPLASATTDRSAPGKPTLEVAELSRRLIVSWDQPPTPTGGLSISRYQLQKWDAANRRWVDLVPSTTATEYTDRSVETGKRYFYRVRAYNSMGEGPWSTLAGGTVQ